MHLIDANDKTNRLYVSQEVIECMQRIPPIDPESLRPQGRWIKGELQNGDRRHKCSVCRDECRVPTVVGKPIYDYCPNCGAKMKGGTP